MLKNCFLVILFCALGWHSSALSSTPFHSIEEPLVTKQRGHQYGSLNEEKDSNKLVPKQNQISKNFKKQITELTKAFENFDSLSEDQKKTLLNKWAPEVKNYGTQLVLSIQGFDERLTVSRETERKLAKIQALYPKDPPVCIIS